MTRAIQPPRSKKRRPFGATMVASALSLTILFGFIFLLFEVSWGMFAKAKLQHAVREGVRYAVTSQPRTTSGGKSIGEMATLKQVVQLESMGFLSSSDMTSCGPSNTTTSCVAIRIFPSTSTWLTALADENGVPTAGADGAGHLILISVKHWKLKLNTHWMQSTSNPVAINVTSGDLIESDGTGTTPPSHIS